MTAKKNEHLRKLFLPGHIMFALFIVALALPAIATAQENDLETAKQTVQLRKKAWEDLAFGLMVYPPAAAKESPGSEEKALVHFADGKRYTLSVSIRETENALEIPEIVRQANNDIGFNHPSFVILKLGRESVRVANRPAARIYFRIEPDKKTRQPWVIGQTFVKIDPFTIAVIRIEFDMANLEAIRPIYEKVLENITLKDPAELEKKRVELVERGAVWLGLLTHENMVSVLKKEEQWFRILNANGRDLGYIRVTEELGDQKGRSGIIVRSESRILQNGIPVDTIRRMFLDESGSWEVWDFRTTVRPKANPPGLPRNSRGQGNPGPAGPIEQSWAETGLRGDQEIPLLNPNQDLVNAITVSRESPAGVDELQWETPEKGYLSQVQISLLGRLLPRKLNESYAFYSYRDGEIVLRHEKVDVKGDGTYVVTSIPNIKKALRETHHYDRNGRLIKTLLPSGRVIQPAGIQQIKAIWHLR